MKKELITTIVIGLLVFFPIRSTKAAVVIADFETDTIGSSPSLPVTSIMGNVTVEESAGFSGVGSLISSYGNFAYLTTGPSATGAGSSTSDRTGEFGPEFDIADMEISFFTDRNYWVYWEFSLFTSELNGGNPDIYNTKLDGNNVYKKAVNNPNGTFPAESPTIWWDNLSITGPNGSSYTHAAFFNSIYQIGPGAHTLEFFVGDAINELGDSAILVDNIELRAVPIPGAIWLLGSGLIALVGFRKKLRN